MTRGSQGPVANALTLVLLAALALSFGVQDWIGAFYIFHLTLKELKSHTEGAVIGAVIILNTTYVSVDKSCLHS